VQKNWVNLSGYGIVSVTLTRIPYMRVVPIYFL
jgi:hypothetical protein